MVAVGVAGRRILRRRGMRLAGLVAVVVVASGVPLATSAAAWGTGDVTRLVSATPTGVPGAGASTAPSLSRDGNLIVFTSTASDLVTKDTNGVADIFLRNQRLATTSLVSVGFNGQQSNGESSYPAVSADGTRVAFVSTATNLVRNPMPNHNPRVYVRNLTTKTTEVASIWSGGKLMPWADGPLSISATGRYVAFAQLGGESGTVYRRDMTARATVTVSTGMEKFTPDTNWTSYEPSISGDGRFVAFTAFDEMNGGSAVFLRDVTQKTSTMLSKDWTGKASDGTLARISGNGQYVSFLSWGALLKSDTNGAADLYVYNRTTKGLTRAAVAPEGAAPLSSDGHVVAFLSRAALLSSDTNGKADVYVYNFTTHATYRASFSTLNKQMFMDSTGTALSQDGRHVAFVTASSAAATGDVNWADDVLVRNSGS